MAPSKKKFKDTDLNKAPSLDELFGGVLESFDESPAPEADPVNEPEAPALETKNEPTPTDSPAAPEPTPAPATSEPEVAPEPAKPIADATEGDESKSEEELMKEFEKILFESTDVTDAAQKLKDAQAAGESGKEETQKLLAEIEQFKAKEQAWKDSMQKALSEISNYESERTLSELEMSKKNRIYELVMEDDSMKTLVALKKQADENPEKAADFKEFLNEFYEKHTGNKISEMISQSRKAEKMAMGGGSSGAEANPGMGGLGDVLEDL